MAYKNELKLKGSSKWGQSTDFSTYYNAKDIIIVLDNEQLVGYCQVEEKPTHFYIRMLVVTPEHQSKGIGKHLLKSLKDKSIKCNKNINLEMFKINTVEINGVRAQYFLILVKTVL